MSTITELAKNLGVKEEIAFDLDQMTSSRSVDIIPTLSPKAIDTIFFTDTQTLQQLSNFDENIIQEAKKPASLTALEIEDLRDSIRSSVIGSFDIDIQDQLRMATLTEQAAITSALNREIDVIVNKMFKEEINFSTISDLVSNMTDQIVDSAVNLVNGVIGTIGTIVDSIIGSLTSAVANVIGFVNNIISNFFSTIVGAIYGAIFGPLNILAGFMKQYWDAIIQVMTTSYLAGKFFFDTAADVPKELGLGFADIRHGVLPGTLTQRPLTKHPLLPSESDVHRVSRGDDSVYQPGGMKYNYDSQRDPLIQDPPMGYDATYPYNHYFETESGHVFEYDDTPSHERIQYKHRTGTGIHVNPDGSQREMIVAKNYKIVLSDDNVHIHGSANVFIDGSANLSVNNDLNINVGLNCNLSVGKNFIIDVGERFGIRGQIQNRVAYGVILSWGMPRVKPLHDMHIPKLGGFYDRHEGDDATGDYKTYSSIGPQDIKEGLERGELGRAEHAERIPDALVPTEEDPVTSKPSAPSILIPGQIRPPTNPNDWRDKAYDQKISDYFYLRDMCHANLYVHALRAQCQLSLQALVDRLTNLARVAGDRIIQQYGNAGFSTYGRKPGPVIMTCAFRRQACGSWHPKGCAADFQFSGIAKSEYYNRAIWMRDNIPGFDHILLEFKSTGTTLPWIHIGVVPGQARGKCETWWNFKPHSAGFKNLESRAKK
jgi:hypothetical protein